jgi:hypothetical protein
MKRISALCGMALLAAFSVPTDAFAATLGKMTVLSRLNQPLNAEIEILDLQPGEAQTLSARLLSRDRTLAGIRVSIGRRNGRPIIRVRTSRALSEPYLQLPVELRSARERRERSYTALIDPTGYAAAPAKPKPASQPKPTAQLKPSAPPKAAPDARSAAPPSSRDELFGLTEKTPSAPPASREQLFGLTDKPPTASSREELFGVPAAPAATATEPARAVEWRGFVQNYSAYDYKDPSHWSRAVVRTQLGALGGSGDFKWRATGRLDLDPVYAGSDFYPEAVRRDQRRDFFLRETYIDTKVGGLDLRIGKQNIVWGEMVGLFFADVVSARDQRDFVLPEFEIIRIPQWALRVERFGDNTHAELIWLPAPAVDQIGQPGAEFYPVQSPAPAGFTQRFEDPVRPARSLRNSNLGLRASMLRSGWDLSAFYYRSTDVSPTFYRDVTVAPTPSLTFVPRHDRIWQVGSTLGKDFGPTVAKAEVIYTSGRKHPVSRLTEPGGVVPQDSLDYVVGLDFILGTDTRLNLQYFERVFFDYDPDLLQEHREGGVTLLLAGKMGRGFEPELLIIQSVNRRDRLVRTKLGWIPATNWRLTFGVDVFDGPATGLFGRFDDNDRAYVEVRRDF